MKDYEKGFADGFARGYQLAQERAPRIELLQKLKAEGVSFEAARAIADFDLEKTSTGMTASERHYLTCQDENCERAYCVDRRASRPIPVRCFELAALRSVAHFAEPLVRYVDRVIQPSRAEKRLRAALEVWKRVRE